MTKQQSRLKNSETLFPIKTAHIDVSGLRIGFV